MTPDNPVFVGLLFCGCCLFMACFVGLLLWVQKRNGYGPQATITPSAPAPRERPQAPPAAPSLQPVSMTRPAVSEPARVTPVSFATTWRLMIADAVHLLIVGETEAGKSTAARATLAGRTRAGDQVIILDPHSNPKTWGGLPAIGKGRDFKAIDAAMLALLGEMTARYQVIAEDASYQPTKLSIFVDEWPAIRTSCPKTATQFITQLAQEGRKAGMRLVMMTQSDLVSSLGIEGKGDVRENFLMLLLGHKAITRCPDAELVPWPAALRRGEGTPRAALTTDLPACAEYPVDLRSLWQPTGQAATTLPRGDVLVTDEEIEGMLSGVWRRSIDGGTLLSTAGVTGNSAPLGVENGPKLAPLLVTDTPVLPDIAVVNPGSSDLPADDLSVAIRLLVNGGMSRNKVVALGLIPGTRNDQLRRIKMALGEANEGGAV